MFILLTEILMAWKSHLGKTSNGCACWRDDTFFQLCIFTHRTVLCIANVNQKRMHNLKVASCFIQQTFLGLQAWEAASQVTFEKLLQGGEGVR